MTKQITKNTIKCLKCGDSIESKHQHDFQWCKCGAVFVDGGLTYRRIGGDLDMMQNECEVVDVWEDGDKIRCIDGSKQKTLELGKVYTADTSMNTTEDRVYIKENKRFSFLKSRFKLLEE